MKKDVFSLIQKVKELEVSYGLPFRKSKIKELRKEILKKLEGHFRENYCEVGNFVVIRAFQNSDYQKPYLQFFTKESWEKAKTKLEMLGKKAG